MLTIEQAAKMTGLHANEITTGINAALEARKKARAKKSNFMVGSSIVVSERNVFVGANVEIFSDTGSCAEQAAINNFTQSQFEPDQIQAIFVTGAPTGSEAAIECTPCGGCRDRMVEFLPDITPVITVSLSGEIFNVHRLKDLHPVYYADQNRAVDMTAF